MAPSSRALMHAESDTAVAVHPPPEASSASPPDAAPPADSAEVPTAPLPEALAGGVDAYLRALGIEAEADRERWTAAVLARVRARATEAAAEDLGEVAIESCQEILDEWLGIVLTPADPEDRSACDLASARSALLNGAVPGWPDDLLLSAADTARVRARLAAEAPVAVPPPAPLAMEAQTVELARAWWRRPAAGAGAAPESRPPPRRGRLRLRRVLYLALVLANTAVAMGLLQGAFNVVGLSPLEIVLLVLYAILFSWICASFWSACFGFVLLVARGGRVTSGAAAPVTGAGPLDPQARTVVLVPIHNEEPERVFAGVRAVWESLRETGEDGIFEVFVLSDTRDPDLWIEEERQWHLACRDLDARGRIHYRNRRENVGKKSGNVADFIHGWGARYRYAIILDADSVMAGATLVEMVRRMEAHPDVGLIQAPPVPVNRETLFARVQQFAASAYGPLFTAGAAWWQADEGNFWGHNAIVRVEPFARHCGLPRLPGREPFGGEIFSQDFVEAALFARAGWKVWLAFDLGGSYEEIPPTIIDYAKRDRRWCQGNLQHIRLISAHGLHPVSRVHFLMGVMSYLSSPLWLVFLIITGLEAYVQSRTEPVYFFADRFGPVWPISYAVELQTVLGFTLAMLFLPKVLALILTSLDPARRAAFGGVWRLSLSALLETVFSVLAAPVLMLFQSKFVWAIVLRRSVAWAAQQRLDRTTGLGEALRTHGGQTLVGVASGVAAWLYVPHFFWWFVPVLAGLLLAVPLSILSSSIGLGRCARRLGLFLTPEESRQRAPVLRTLDRILAEGPAPALDGAARRCMRDPGLQALHFALIGDQVLSRRQRHYLQGLLYKLMEEGVAALPPAELRALLSHRDTLRELHTLAWSDLQVAAAEGPSPVP